ncbi:MAG: hypothetical protein KF773_27265 [Deltaproteobacteria bacterium]|nr:hypothetical protein [Deltaproteobacteria bacterium]MCW5803017.1 hypothetical protein [Deltaproteobacteria bacterium]
MKPAIAILPALLLAACVGQAPEGGDDEPPPRIKEPPTPKGTGSTAAGCEGVTDLGKCEDGVALTCDVDAGALRRKDCKALGKACVMDPQRGAKCDVAPEGAGANGSCGSFDNDGTCSADGKTATWCGTDGQLIVWNCTQQLEGMGGLGGAGWTCQFNKPNGFPGAFCYEGGASQPPSDTADCGTIKYAGVCDTATDTAVWCQGAGDGNGGTGPFKKYRWACGTGQSCQIDQCGPGAMCCNDAATPPPAQCTGPNNIGVEGRCKATGTVEYCLGETLHTQTCSGGQTCKVNVCGEGAWCCN